MNVVSGMDTSANLHPHPQPKPDTQPVTVSGQWATCAPTSKLIPRHPREDERQVLLWAAESGYLAFRRIKLTKENDYFSGKGAPRPFTLALPGKMMPVARVPDGFGKWMVGIVNPQCLYVYKHNAYTEPDMDPDKLSIKLLPDLQSLHEKCLENANQAIWRVYPRFTSGHLRADGTFSLPGLVIRNNSHAYNYLDYPELVLTNYSKEDIRCFFVYLDTQMNIADILQDKRHCEEVLELKQPLPMVIYCHRTGSVQVCFDDELDSKHLALNEHSLDDFAFSQGIDQENFRAMLNLLPMPLRTEALSWELTASPDVFHKLQQAIKLVSDPCCYSSGRLLELKQSGLPIHHRFFHNKQGYVTSLLEKLLITEMLRNDQPGQEQIREQEEEACRLLQLLLQSGSRMDQKVTSVFYCTLSKRESAVMRAGTMNYMVAAFAPFEFLSLEDLKWLPLIGYSGSVVEFDRICRGLSQQQRQSRLEELLCDYLGYPLNLDIFESHLLALFHYGASLNKDILARVKHNLDYWCHDGRKVIGNLSVAGFIQWFEGLWKQRNKHPFYLNWSEHVRQANLEIADLKQSLGLSDDACPLAAPVETKVPAALQFMVDAFSKPPVLPDNVGDNESTILKVLQHYYRRPGPERVIQSLGRHTLPTVWKPLHSCSHVLRARNNGLWYMELLEKFQLHYLRPEKKELLALAIIYHAAAAEDVAKSVEETRSADYFKRDLIGHYPEPLLKDMAKAMVSKENDVNGADEQNLSDSVRWYLRILRFADRMDIIRCCGVGADFPGSTVGGFDATRLDLPPQLPWDFTSGPGNGTEFQRHLVAAMHGAADLAQVTGQPNDHREKKYTEAYGLIDNGSEISEHFEWTTEPVERMNRFIDDNVRRTIAQAAGIIVCSDPYHQACRADQSKGITYGIHNSWYDLHQIEIPAGMTLLEKMQYRHNPSLLSPATQQALEQEVQRLKSQGIRMNPGTLTQETLTSSKAQEVLKERGITVVCEKRPYCTDDDRQLEKVMFVPKQIPEPARSQPENQPDTDQGFSCQIL
ncbi:hypothetical protein [Endozoicomonas sp. ALC013]|uniref:hypothetical protein n=1 Tax=Endozoicomonas sp. ALC013 TaxID=3403076 RepID=UPI003BB80927